MGWGNCGRDSKGRPIGYLHAATCDHPGCDAKIDRGLSYACGQMHGTGGELCATCRDALGKCPTCNGECIDDDGNDCQTCDTFGV